MDALLESLKTAHNLIEIAVLLTNLGKRHLLPTILELLYLEAQDIVDNYCVVREE